MKKFTIISLAALFTATFQSCDEILEIDPPTDSLTSVEVYNNTANIKTALTGLYSYNIHMNPFIYQYADFYLPFLADELKTDYASYKVYFQNSYVPTTSFVGSLWQYLYESIYKSNDFIANLENNGIISENSKAEYLAVARWFRAYNYLFLTNLYGDVPLVKSNDISESRNAARSSVTEINKLIEDDLVFAVQALANSDDTKQAVRTRLTSVAAQALLSRYYLYTEQWQNAANEATKIIANASYSLESDVNKVFYSSSKEIIFGYDMDGFAGLGTYQGYTRPGVLFIPTTSSRVPYYLTDELVAVLTSNESDARNGWIGYLTISGKNVYYPYKYKNYKNSSGANYELQVQFRLAEQYLIRAEARAQLNDIQGALSDINTIRSRAGIEEVTASTKDDVLLLIEKERRLELFIEGQAHRWFDLKRTGRADAVYGALDYKKWEHYKALLPIPEQQIGRNHALTQNEGYIR